MNILESMNAGDLFETMSKTTDTEFKSGVEKLLDIVSLMQAYRFIEQLEELGKKHPELKKVCMVCLQTDYNDEGMYDGAYFDCDMEVVGKEGKKYKHKMMQAFNPYEYEKVKIYRQRNRGMDPMRGRWGNKKSDEVQSEEECFKEKVREMNEKITDMFLKTCSNWASDLNITSWVGEQIQMKNPKAVLENVYPVEMVQQFEAQIQKRRLEQKLSQEGNSSEQKIEEEKGQKIKHSKRVRL